MSSWYWSPLPWQRKKEPYEEPPQVGDAFIIHGEVDGHEDVAIGRCKVEAVYVGGNILHEGSVWANIYHSGMDECYVPRWDDHFLPNPITIKGNFKVPHVQESPWWKQHMKKMEEERQ